MTYIPEDSDRYCPVTDCGKKMVLDIGQNADTGWVEIWHECLHDGYRELDTQWKRTPVLELVPRSGLTGTQRLRALRDGVPVPMQYDTAPFPVSEFVEAGADA
jgi:hypothetical protein